MRHSTSIALAVVSILLLCPLTALAHEHRVYSIGNKQYNITVGALNEPVYVDDKSGVEVIISDLSAVPHQQPMADGMEEGIDGPVGVPVTELETSIRVLVTANDQKKTFALEPKEGMSGTYQAVFYPTVQTTYTFTVTGTINGLPVDFHYTCNPAGHVRTDEDKTTVRISDQVILTLKGGTFGCAQAKVDAEFPEKAGTALDLLSRVEALEQGSSRPDTGMFGLVAGALGILVGAVAWRKATYHTH